MIYIFPGDSETAIKIAAVNIYLLSHTDEEVIYSVVFSDIKNISMCVIMWLSYVQSQKAGKYKYNAGRKSLLYLDSCMSR